jgi:cell division protein FtsZ
MPTGKRASMREGPLAALFRKTADDPGETEEKPKRSSPKARQRDSAPAPESPRQPATRPATRAARASRAPAVPEPAVPEVEIPSPQERLRQAFSADIPHSLLDPPTRQAETVDPFARPQRVAESFAAPAPIGQPVIRVVGVGGAGVNAVNRMVEAEIEGVEFLAINTDLQSLQLSAAHETLHIGDSVTRGLGSGSDPDLGRRAAHEEYDRIKAMLRGSDMVFIAAGAGGGTGTGAAPIVSHIARELGALTVGIVTRPFQFEGSRRRAQAEDGIAQLSQEVDTLIVVPNNRLLTVLDRNTSMVDAFRVADDVLRQGVQGISDLVTLPGLINLDFADVRTIMSGAGTALLGIGMGTGERRAIDAAERAVASPLLETSMEGAHSILLSITGSPDLSLWEVNEAAKAVAEAAHPEANIIFGAMIDDKLDEQVWVTVVATGYGDARRPRIVTERPGAGESRTESSLLREPGGEPRVSRVRDRPERSQRTERVVTELDIPEFIPRR